MASAALGVFVIAAPASAAGLDEAVSFNIPAQALDAALVAYSQQSGVQVISAATAVSNKTAPALHTQASPRTALTTLLRGSGLSFVAHDKTVTIVGQAESPLVRVRNVVQAVRSPPPPPPPVVAQPVTSRDQLEEVVVTATRQTSTVNRVPLSISASTQETLDQQGIKSISDLQRTVPSLSVSGAIAGVQTFAIRGVFSNQGAATVGVYLDDVALQKRFPAGPIGPITSGGTPAPPLFDLERVEVLRGPQGTLYGGSSEGGTIRFITPTPSLTTYSGMGRAEVSSVKDGGVGGEVGVAVGGPIVQDRLGFRLSVLDRHTAGYIDIVDPYNNGALVKKDANSNDTFSARATVLWAPTSRLKVTTSVFASKVKDGHSPNQWSLPVAGTFTTPSLCFNTTRQFGQSPAPTVAVTCPANAVSGQTVGGIYKRPSYTYGPFDYLKRNDQLGITTSPTQSETGVANVTLDYDFGWVRAKSITAYLYDRSEANTLGAVSFISTRQTTTAFPGASGFPLSTLPVYPGRIVSYNQRYGMTEELRLSSAPDAGRLSWVAGVFLSRIRNRAHYVTGRDEQNQFTGPMFGLTPTQVYGVPQLTPSNSRDQTLYDTEEAIFGEANYKITDKLILIAGLRKSRTAFTFDQAINGVANGWNVPTVANTGLTSGSVTVTPLTPKVGLQYSFTPSRLIYVSAAKGFRGGGVNTPIQEFLCGAALATAGLKVTDVPTTYGPDTVWSYEAGGKFRLMGGRLQVNSSIFRIDWKDVQLTISGIPGCPQNWVQNAGAAVSKGFDFDTQAKLFGGLSASFSLGYTDAQYSQTVRVPAPSGSVGAPLVRGGDPFPVPKWQTNLGLRYEFKVMDHGAYIRGDYFYQGKYLRSPGPGVSQYAPDTYQAPSVTQVNLRAGVALKSWDINAYANNVLDSQDELTRGGYGSSSAGGRGGCSIAQGAACTTFTTYNPFVTVGTLRPREVGVQATYRF